MITARVAGLIFLGGFAATSQAATLGRFYVGVGGGNISIDDRAYASPPLAVGRPMASINSLRFDSSDTSWTAFAGYSVLRFLDIEGGYSDHGQFAGDGPGCVPDASLSVNEFFVRANGQIPLGKRVSATAHGGVLRARFDVETGVRTPPPGVVCIALVPPPFASPNNKTGTHWGVGLTWRATERVGLRASYELRKFQVVDAGTAGISLLFYF